jgi:hypothetical protein
MQKLIFKTAIFFFIPIFFFATFLTYGKMIYTSPEYPIWLAKTNYINSANSRSENIIIGDSRAVAGFVPAIIGDDYYNLAIGGETPLEGYYTLKRYLEKNKSVKNLIISYAPMHLQVSDTFFERTLKYDFLDDREVAQAFQLSNEYNEKFWIDGEKGNSYGLFEYPVKFVYAFLIKYKFFYFYRAEIRNMIFENRLQKNLVLLAQLDERKGNIDFGIKPLSDELNYEAKEKEFNISLVQSFYLTQLLELADHNNIKVYYINAPFNEASYKEINASYLSKYNSFFNELKSRYPYFVFYSEIFSYDNQYFGDPSHLNQKGQEKFSTDVKMKLNHK